VGEVLDFISEMVSSIAWPLTVFLLGLVFRKPLRGLFDRLTKAKTGETELVFERSAEVRQIVSEAKSIETDAKEKPQPKTPLFGAVLPEWGDPEISKITDLFDEDRIQALSQSWTYLMEGLRERAQALPHPVRSKSFDKTLKALAGAGIIDSMESQWIKRLGKVKDRWAKFGPTAPPGQTFEIMTIFLRLGYALRNP
jgi:hypothetical protein